MRPSDPFLERYKVPLFLLGCVGLFAYLGIFKHLFEHPQGIHFIRQTDSLAFIHHYLLNGMDLFSPGVLNLNSDHGNVVSEFPVFYALIASLSKLGLDPVVSLRCITLLFTILGLFGVFQLSKRHLNSWILATLLTVLLFSSSVWIYYANGFTPDPLALGLTLFGIYLFDRLTMESGRKVWLTVFCVSAFTLASLMRITYAIYPIAIAAYMILYSKKYLIGATGPRWSRLFLGLLALGGLISAAWVRVAQLYNKANHDYYFTTSIKPYWSLETPEIKNVWRHITEYWYTSYYHEFVIYLIGLALVATLLFCKRVPALLRLLIGLSSVGFMGYFFLFFHQFKDHDYYMLPAIPLVILSLVSLIYLMRDLVMGRGLLRGIPYILLLIMVFIALPHGKKKFNERYGNRNDLFASYAFTTQGLPTYLDSLLVPRTARFVVIPDLTTNGGLVCVERMGWPLADTLSASVDKLATLMTGGADYVLVTDSSILENPRINSLLLNRLGAYNGNLIYRTE